MYDFGDLQFAIIMFCLLCEQKIIKNAMIPHLTRSSFFCKRSIFFQKNTFCGRCRKEGTRERERERAPDRSNFSPGEDVSDDARDEESDDGSEAQESDDDSESQSVAEF